MLKTALQTGIRSLHALACDRGLPDRLGIYLHSLSPELYGAFREMADALREAGYRFVGPADFIDHGPGKRAFVSFDDNYRAWHRALPLFDELDLRATFYVNTCCFRDRADAAARSAYFDRLRFEGERETLSTGELREMAAAGHTIGAHTHAHHCLTALAHEEACCEIRTSKDVLEDLLGAPVVDFSYPYGMRRHFNEALREYCRSIGLTRIANGIPGMLHAEQRPEALHRTGWDLGRSLRHNLTTLSIDGRLFERLTGRSAVA